MSTYEPLRKGNSESSKEGYKYALRQFNQFLKELGLPSEELCTEQVICDVEIFEKFADYLLKHEDGEGETLSAGTALQYLSGAKTIVKKKYPRNPIFKTSDDEDDWYSNLRDELEDRIYRRCLEQGIALSEKSMGIDRDMLTQIVTALMHRNTPEVFLARSALVSTWQASGRSGEASLTALQSLKWYMRTINFNWNERKTNRQTFMPFFPDRDSYHMCMFHSLACYRVIYNALHGGSTQYSEVAGI